jgi:AraC-like DNA-binding protein
MHSQASLKEAGFPPFSIRIGSVSLILAEQESAIRQPGRFIYVAQGGVWVRVGRQAYCLSKQWGIWLPPGVVCLGYPVMDAVLIEVAAVEGPGTDLSSEVTVLRSSASLCAMLNELQNELKSELKASEEATLVDQDIATPLAAALAAAPVVPDALVINLPAYDSRLCKVCETVLRNPNKDGQLEKAAAVLEVTVRTLGRIFRDELGTSAARWRRNVQIAAAFCALDNGTSVAEVAARLGYGASAFSTFFRSKLGYSPRQQKLRGVERDDSES